MGLFFSAVAALGIAVLIWFVWTFNRFVRGRNRLREGWSGIEVQLKRRWDLVPNLVKCVDAYQKHERELLENVVRHRSEASAARDVREANGAETKLSRDLGSIFLLVEAYPELKADQNFRGLHETLVEIEDALQYARRYYNGCARDLNNLAEGFPSMIVARLFGFRAGDYFEIENATERMAPSVGGLTA